MLVKIIATLTVLCFCNVQGFSFHRVSNLKVVRSQPQDQQEDTDSPFATASVDNQKNQKATINLKFSALDTDLEMNLALVDGIFAHNATIEVPGTGQTLNFVNTVYSASQIDAEGNEIDVFVNAVNNTVLNGYVKKDGVDYKFTPLRNMRREIENLAKTSNDTRYVDQLAELDQVFGVESAADAEEMVLVDLNDLPEDALHQYTSASASEDSTENNTDLDHQIPAEDYTTDSVDSIDSITQRNPLALTMWPDYCHPHMTKRGAEVLVGIVDLMIDFSAYTYYNNHFVSLGKSNNDIELITAHVAMVFSRANYYFFKQLNFGHSLRKIIILNSGVEGAHFPTSMNTQGRHLICKSLYDVGQPLCKVTVDSYVNKLAQLRPLWPTLVQDGSPQKPYSASLIVFTGLFGATNDARSKPDTYAKMDKLYESISMIPAAAPRPYNTLAKMLGNQMGARATNTPANVLCYPKGPKYLSGIMGNSDGFINVESLDAGQVGFAKGCQFTDMCNYLKATFSSTNTTPNTVVPLYKTYNEDRCGNYIINEDGTC